MVELLTSEFADRVTLPVRESVAARDAYSAGMPLSVYAPTSPVSVSYIEALKPVEIKQLDSITNDVVEAG